MKSTFFLLSSIFYALLWKLVSSRPIGLAWTIACGLCLPWAGWNIEAAAVHSQHRCTRGNLTYYTHIFYFYMHMYTRICFCVIIHICQCVNAFCCKHVQTSQNRHLGPGNIKFLQSALAWDMSSSCRPSGAWCVWFNWFQKAFQGVSCCGAQILACGMACRRKRIASTPRVFEKATILNLLQFECLRTTNRYSLAMWKTQIQIVHIVSL